MSIVLRRSMMHHNLIGTSEVRVRRRSQFCPIILCFLSIETSGGATALFHQISPLIRRRRCTHQKCWQKRWQEPMHPKKSTSSFSTTPERSIANAAQNYMQINNNDIDPSSNSNNNNPICRIVATSDGKISSSTAVPSLSPSSRALLDKIELLYAVESQKQLRNLAYMQPQSTVVPMKPTTEAIDGINTVVGQVEDTMVSILKKALDDGGYRLMRQRDLDLCSALNAGYLLRLSLLPDIKDLDPCVGREFYPELYEQPDDTGPKYVKGRDTFSNTDNLLFDGRVLVFRRGYSKEITTGRLLLPKLDYLQASLVQRSSSAATRKLGEFEQHLEDLFQGFIAVLNNIVQGAYDQLLRQLQKFGVGALRYLGLSMNSGDIDTGNGANQTLSLTPEDDESTAKLSSYGSTRGNKVFKFTRYQASSSMISNSFDLNDALSPFLLCSNVDNTKCSEQGEMYGSVKNGPILCQYDENFPSVRKKSVGSFSLLERVSIQNTVDFFTKRGRRELIRNYFKSSTLVEPAFEEVIVISKPMRRKTPKTVDIYPPSWLYEAARIFDVEDRLPHPKNKTQVDAPTIPPPIDIKVFSDVPMANIEAVLPKSKLIFRPADAVVFDLVSVISFLAVAGSLRFDSPKLDLFALLSLIVFVVQTFFRYSNKYARYDLIVNKFITSKVVYRGPGALKYIVSEANSNRALRAMLTRDWLLSNSKVLQNGNIGDAAVEEAKSHINTIASASGTQIDIDVLSALDDLTDLQLINNIDAKDEQAATDAIENRWSTLLRD